jgi:hypothetical protein
MSKFSRRYFVYAFLLGAAILMGKAEAGLRLHGNAATGCPMTGIFDLSNTCNNIYLLTGTIR